MDTQKWPATAPSRELQWHERVTIWAENWQPGQIMADPAATAELEFERMQDSEFQDVLKQIALAVDDVHAGRYDSRLKSLNITKQDLADLTPQHLIVRKGQNLTGVEVALVLIAARAGAKVSSKVVLDVWSHIVMPRLEQRYGPRVRSRQTQAR
jgi:hypothetical protein